MEEREERGEEHNGIIGTLAISTILTLSIITWTNILGFPFEIAKTFFHFLVTYFILHIAKLFKLFEHRPLDEFSVLKLGFLNGISVGLLNLMRGYNSVGLYQMTNLAIIPFTALVEMFFYGNKFSRKTQISMLILLIGVGIATVTDLQLNLQGCVLSLLAIATTCVAHIMISRIQIAFQVSAMQLLYHACPYQASILLLIGPVLEYYLAEHTIFTFDYSPLVPVFIVISCFISTANNFSTFHIIGKTSPMTYQVLEQLKTFLVLVFGYTLFHNPVNWRNILGIFIAMIGMVLYYFSSNIAP